jgi:hypothetical protein
MSICHLISYKKRGGGFRKLPLLGRAIFRILYPQADLVYQVPANFSWSSPGQWSAMGGPVQAD